MKKGKKTGSATKMNKGKEKNVKIIKKQTNMKTRKELSRILFIERRERVTDKQVDKQ